MKKVTRYIPSWWLAVSGAFMVGVSATLGPLLLWNIEDEIQEHIRQIEVLQENTQGLWDEGVSSDQRMANIGVLLSLAENSEDAARKFALDRAWENAFKILINSFGILRIDAKSCLTGPPDSQYVADLMDDVGIKADTCSDFYDQLESGEIEAFRSLAKLREKLWWDFGDRVKENNEGINDRRGIIREANAKIKRVQLLVTFFSLIGLLLLLLKDVPVWRETARRENNSGDSN